MGHSKPESLVSPLKGGTGTSRLAPPWARDQVKWLGHGFFVLRLATEETSRWLLGAGFRWNDVFPHERTFRRSAEDKCELMSELRMNPWPVHLAAALDPLEWRSELSSWVEQRKAAKVLDTGHVTLWRVEQLPVRLLTVSQFAVLDGHHSRKAQRNLGLRRVFGWLEPLGVPQLSVRSIDRGGWLADWLKDELSQGGLRELSAAPDPGIWTADRSRAFEVVQGARRFWCEIAQPVDPGEAAIDALARLAKGKVFLKSSSSFDEILGWLAKLEIDTALRLPPPTKDYVLNRALARSLFPQKATYFYPKVPFGLLVEDLK